VTNSEFDQFVLEQLAAATGEKKINWEEKKQAWLQSLTELYEEIARLLVPYKGKGVAIEYSTIQITEDFIGEYEATACAILIGRIPVRLIPVGTNLVGAKGRVDVLGPRGRGRFVLVDEAYVSPESKRESAKMSKRSFVWRIVSPPPRLHYSEITQESLQNLLLAVTRG
jgi:hypothetical protein